MFLVCVEALGELTLPTEMILHTLVTIKINSITYGSSVFKIFSRGKYSRSKMQKFPPITTGLFRTTNLRDRRIFEKTSYY